MMTPLNVSLVTLGVMLLTFFAHEFGHLLMAVRLGLDPKFSLHLSSVDMRFSTRGLSRVEIKSVYVAGIVCGVFPLFLFFFVEPVSLGVFLFVVGLLLHVQSVLYDVRVLRELGGGWWEALLLFSSPLGLAGVVVVVFLLGGFLVWW